MKKIMALILAVVLSVSMGGLLIGCGRGDSDIQSVSSSPMESNGTNMPLYRVTLKDSIDWSALTDAEREKIAVAAFKQAQKKRTEDGSPFNYSIVGYNPSDPTNAPFLYDAATREMLILVDGKPTARVAVEVPDK
jgi:hypothetical protein